MQQQNNDDLPPNTSVLSTTTKTSPHTRLALLMLYDEVSRTRTGLEYHREYREVNFIQTSYKVVITYELVRSIETTVIRYVDAELTEVMHSR